MGSPPFRSTNRRSILAAPLATLPGMALGAPHANAHSLRLEEIGPLMTGAGALVSPGGFRQTGTVAPDGRRVALAPDMAIAVFDVETRMQAAIAIPSAHRDYTAAFSPDSRFLAIGSYRTLRLFDLDSQRQVWRNRQENAVWWDPWTVSFRPGGRTIALTGSHENVALVDAESGRIVHLMGGHAQFVGDHAFTRDGGVLVTGPDESGLVILWDPDRGVEMRRLQIAPGMWSALSADDAHLIASRTQQTIDVWSLSTGERVNSFATNMNGATRMGAAGRLRCTLAGPERRWVVVAAERTNQLKVFDWSTGAELLDAVVEGGGPYALAAFPDGCTLLNGDPARIWSIEQA